MKKIQLFKGTKEDQPKHIILRDSVGVLIGIIYCDQEIAITSTITLDLLNKIKTITENFNLFYDNI